MTHKEINHKQCVEPKAMYRAKRKKLGGVPVEDAPSGTPNLGLTDKIKQT